MPINFNCSRCGKPLVAPDGTTGKKTTCPKCQTKQLIPEAIYEADVLEEPAQPAPQQSDDSYSIEEVDNTRPQSTERKRPCPMCGELIVATAMKCRYCGEIFDAALRKSRRADEDSELTGGEIALCILCGGIGCIMGLVFLVQGKSAKGGKMIGISFLAGIIWTVIRLVAILAIQPR